MAYSRITEVEVINFMTLKHAKVVFDGSNILNIKGYNDSGKSALLRAVAVCVADLWKNKQVKFIRYNCEFFRVILSFDDDVRIVRDKYYNGQSLYEMYKNGELIFTTKQGGSLSKISGVPTPIADYLGMCIVDGGCLNYQSCVDRLYLVETTGSENYQMVHTVLKAEELSRASAMINSDRNKLSSEITEIEASLQITNQSLLEVRDLTESFLLDLVEKDSKYDTLAGRKSELETILSVQNSLESIVDVPELSVIDTTRLKLVSDIVEVLSSIDSLVDIPDIHSISYERLVAIESACNCMGKLESLQSNEYPTINEIATDKYEDLAGITEALIEYANANKGLLVINNEISEQETARKSILKEAKKQGIVFALCDNCGSYTSVKVGEISNA